MKQLALVTALWGALAAAAQEGQDGGLPTVPAADAQALEKLRQLGALAMPLAANTQALTVDFRSAAEQTGDAALEALAPVAERVVWLNLAATKVTDAGLARLAALKNLQRLHLERTGVGDEGLAHLRGLAELRYLNLYGTKVSDKGLEHLKGLKKLRSLFVWQTGVTEAGAEALVKAIPGLYVNRGWEAEQAKLPPPREEPKPDAASTAAKPVNAKCPLSGKEIKADATFLYKNQLIAFCCANCKAKFEKEPEKFVSKVEGFKDPDKKPEAAPAAAKPVNAKCPLSGKEIKADAAFLYKNQLIAFCCGNCKAKFEKEPETFISKVEGFKDPDKK
jgi:YHS domain-containing protein